MGKKYLLERERKKANDYRKRERERERTKPLVGYTICTNQNYCYDIVACKAAITG